MKYDNLQEVTLMVWEVDPKLRNKNNLIKINVKKNITLQISDVIRCGKSNYEILEITETRQSSLEDYNYVTAKTRHFFI